MRKYEESLRYTDLPDTESHRQVRVGVRQFYVCLEEEPLDPRAAPAKIVLTREQLLAFLVALPEDYLHAALRVKTTGDPAPFMPREDLA